MKKLLYILTILILPICASGQNITLKGKVFDNKSNLPIEYAHIHLVNSNWGTITNTMGDFSITVPAETRNDEKIRVSMLGYKTAELSIEQIIKDSCVLMESNAITLNPVKIVAYNTAEGVIKECIRRMESNYWTDTAITLYYFRDWRCLNDSLYEFLEAKYEFQDCGYGEKKSAKISKDLSHVIDTTFIIKHYNASVTDTSLAKRLLPDPHYMRLFKWQGANIYCDIVRFYKKFYFGDTIHLPQMSMTEVQDDKGTMYYKVEYIDRDWTSDKCAVSLIINKNDFAVVEATIKYLDKKHNKIPRIILRKSISKDAGNRTMDVVHMKYEKVNGKYRLTYCQKDIEIMLTTKDDYVSMGINQTNIVKQNVIFCFVGYGNKNDYDNDWKQRFNSSLQTGRYQYQKYDGTWKRDFETPQLELDIIDQLHNRGISY